LDYHKIAKPQGQTWKDIITDGARNNRCVRSVSPAIGCFFGEFSALCFHMRHFGLAWFVLVHSNLAGPLGKKKSCIYHLHPQIHSYLTRPLGKKKSCIYHLKYSNREFLLTECLGEIILSIGAGGKITIHFLARALPLEMFVGLILKGFCLILNRKRFIITVT